ncbi:TRAP transporter small permease [Billgrantia aerodenitrificans]|uniref:TRAP transporter small permease protein n=1 Tax=Billgrantia aerodenitrificans TaxID=2733483 RepID=A0ABS9AN52_9GAMM|nr:TRAP transporter small permease [Halomonas aerodenitrificans]MCE8023202.1 TRAP transporter small permease [Halomonas aerodenitrificans]
MNLLTRLATRLADAIDYLCMAILLVMLASISYQVFARYILNSPTFWSEELARFLIVWLTMLGSASLIKEHDGHISVEYLFDKLSGKLKLAVGFVRDLLTIGMCGLLGYYGIKLAEFGGRTSSSGLGVPMSYPYYAIPVGAFLIALVLLLSRLGSLNFQCCKHPKETA